MSFIVPEHKRKVHSGQRFTRLTVSGVPFLCECSSRLRQSVVCRCDCGRMSLVMCHNLLSGRSQSCGCLADERRATATKTHGMRNTRLYNTWISMKQRCAHSLHHAYKNYGGRGIAVCDEWGSSFQSFYDWAMTSGYRQGLLIERVNNSLGYSPSNCRWATRTEQQANRRNTLFLSAFGETKPITEWVRDGRCVVGRDTLVARAIKYKWNPERAITTPTQTQISNKPKG